MASDLLYEGTTVAIRTVKGHRMNHRDENSVLTSLKDLKHIEEERQDREEAARRARLEAERCAQAEAERLAREEQERRRAEAAEAARAEEEARRLEEREAALRLAEAEAAARVEAEARLEAERLRMEVDLGAKSARRARWILPSLLAVILASGGAVGYVFGVVLPERQRAREAEGKSRLAALEASAVRERKALLARLAEQERALQKAIASAKSGEVVAELRRQLDSLKKKRADVRKPTRQRTRRTRWVRRTPKNVHSKPPMKPDPTLRNNALRGLFEDK